MKRFISFSGGVESSTMCILYGKGAEAIWCDTGAEPNEMYERVDLCEQYFLKLHDGDFKLHRVRAKVNAKGVEVDSLIDYIIQYGYMPSPTQRFCTKEFKIKPIDKFLKELGECELMIGFNADEDDRIGNAEKIKTIKYSYPLIETGLTRADCEEILKKHNLLPNLPFYMSRGGCFMCFYQNLSQLKAMYFFDKATFDRIRKLETDVNNKQKNRQRQYPLFLGIKMTMPQIEQVCEDELRNWGWDEINNLYNKEQQIKPCGAFCHR